MGTYEPTRRRITTASRPGARIGTEPKRADGPTPQPVSRTPIAAPPSTTILDCISILPTAPADVESEGMAASEDRVPSEYQHAHAPIQTMKAAGNAWPPVAPFASAPVQRKNVTGLPESLKAGGGARSDVELDDVRVRYADIPAAQSGIIQRAAITPGTFFGATRADNDVDADINANELTGFGASVNGVTWHTKLVFDPLQTPAAQNGHAMNPEGSGVTGVIGPDHPYGSQPSSLTAAANNLTASTIRADGRVHVAAHIVNDQLGGPGITQNLFAFPGNANTLMETQVENRMKAAVAAGNFIYYRAVVHLPAQGPADYITMSWNKLADDGSDIGGGQAAAVIRANNTSGSTASVALAAGTVANRLSLVNPSNPTVIKATPWGPFQMPDPKQIVALGLFLDYSEFPAVGSKQAFEDFLTNNKANTLGLQLMFASLNDTAMTTTIGRWIGDKSKSQITIKKNRGITQGLLDDLKTGTSAKKEAAFIEIMDTGDAVKIIPFAAGIFAKVARANARSRV